jgi:hypothetical protein
LKWLKIYIFEKIIGRKSEDKNIGEYIRKAKSVNSDLVYVANKTVIPLPLIEYTAHMRLEFVARVTVKYHSPHIMSPDNHIMFLEQV